ncbi:MAG: tetratricopeptide repeat protein [Methanosarcinales archaeon]|nr:tetratricopeptide repeat protein [Methanosarcinales archaeon]
MNEVKETFNTRVERLSNYLNRAYKHNKPSLLFALYVSEFLRTDMENYLNRLLIEQGLEVINIDAGKNKDLPSFFSLYNSHNTVFFVHNIEKGFPEVLQFLNFKREELIEHHVKVVFWIKEEELVTISIKAPDFFAFRNRVVEFMEIPLEREFKPALVELLETDYKSIDEINRSIELKEKLLLELSSETEIYGYLLGSLGILYDQIGLYKISIDRSEKALAISKEIGDRHGEGNHLGNLGLAFSHLGEVEKAIEYFKQALEIDEELNDIRSKATRLNNIGGVYQNWGKPEKALEYYKQAISIFKNLKDERSISIVKKNMDRLNITQQT